MKRKILSVTIILTMLLSTLIPLSVSAATSGTFGNNLKWALDGNGTLTISGTGAMPDWNGGRETPWSDYGSNDSKIKKVIIGDGITTIGNSAFENFRNLETITLNDDIQSIGNYSFNNCYGLKMVRLDLPYSLTSIGKYAFFGCNISIINVPNTVTYIGTNAFAYSENLEELRMQSNTYYSSLNGNLYNGDKTKLIQYLGNDTSFVIPDSVKTIGEYAFYNYNDVLTTITIPETVTKIESSAFYKCSQLKEVIYGGTKAQWDKINIGSSNTSLTNANITYKVETIELTYNLNGGNGEIETVEIEENSSTTISSSIPTKDGYTFFGWSISSSAKTPEYSTNDIITVGTEDITLYAVWKKIICTKTQFLNGIFLVTPTGVENGNRVIFVCYNGDKMVYVNPYVYAGESTIPFSTTETYDKVKVMVWENLETCVPLCEAENVPLN